MTKRIIKRGEVYWMDLPDKGGSELKDKHLGIVISNNQQNNASPVIIILPITSRKKGDKLYHFELETYFNQQIGKILIDQITTIDKTRRIFGKRVAQVEERIMIEIERKVCYVLGLSNEALLAELTDRLIRDKVF